MSINRGRVLGVLCEAAKERLGAGRILTDHHFTGFEEAGNRIIAHFSGNDDGPRPDAEGNIPIGVDGTHYRQREKFYPGEGEPNFAGVML